MGGKGDKKFPTSPYPALLLPSPHCKNNTLRLKTVSRISYYTDV